MKVLKLISSIMYLALTQRVLESETATNTEQTAFKLIAVAHFVFIGYVIFEPILKKINKSLGI